MAWKIVGLVEGRAGVLNVLPDIGEPNEFPDHMLAVRAQQAMTQALEEKERKIFRYVVVPAIDEGLHNAIRNTGAPQQQAPQPPAITGWVHGSPQKT